MKSCIVAIARLEAPYIIEWIEYHLKLGFDKIVIYDNNWDKKENLVDVCKEYINTGKVVMFDFKKEGLTQLNAYFSIYDENIDNRYISDIDWILFIDIDEFLILDSKFKNVDQFLSQKCFNKYDVIKINWKTMTDSGNLIYSDEPVMKRFVIPAPEYILDTTAKFPVLKNQTNKSFVRNHPKCGKDNVTIGVHTAVGNRLMYCNTSGEQIVSTKDIHVFSDYTPSISYDNAYIKHFQTKSIEEYIKYKLQRGWSCFPNEYEKILKEKLNMEMFYSINGYSPIVEQLAKEFAIKYKVNVQI